MDPFEPALEIARSVRARDRSAREVLEAALSRISEVDESLNAFTVVLADRARRQADDVDARVAGGEHLPLAGVPLAVKDHVWLAGAPATNGSRALADFVPDVDCVAVSRLVAAGAVVVGKTNNPEFCYRGDTDSPLWGLTRNPWNLNRTPGGSSGGSGVAVATGMAALAIGTDGGGSIRIPSAFCGTVGHKPTHGLVPTQPGFRGWPTLSVHGPMGRSVPDVASMLEVMAGPDPADPPGVPVQLVPHDVSRGGRSDLRGLRVAVSVDFGFGMIQPEVRRAFELAVATFEELGCELVEAHPRTDDPVRLWMTIAHAEGYASEGPLLEHEDLIDPDTARTVRRGETISSREYLDAQNRRKELCRTWALFLEDFDLIVSPGQQVLPFGVGEPDPSDPGGDPQGGHWWGMDAVANLTGQPVTAVPFDLTESGLPVGLQLMGRRYDDSRLLAAAGIWEASARRLVSHPS
jgi:Asp-tRNA(Asn)/Glu-tRNA(Gln) amidotransferase A subunit family amidase